MTNEELQMKIDHIEKSLNEVKDKVGSLPTREEMQRDNERLIQQVIKECDSKYAPKIMFELFMKISVPVMTAIIVYLVMKSLNS